MSRPTQVVTIQYHDRVDSAIVNKMAMNILPTGVYSNEKLLYSGGNITVPPIVVEIKNTDYGSVGSANDIQARIATSEDTTIACADLYYIIARWQHTTAKSTDLMDILAVAGSSITERDIILGQRYGSSVVYTARSVPKTHEHYFKVEARPTPDSYVVCHGGNININGTTSLVTYNPELTIGTSGTYYVYVTSSGSLATTTTLATAQTGIFIAQITGSNEITNPYIVDKRSFLANIGGLTRMKCGTYVGVNDTTQNVTVGFMPDHLIIMAQDESHRQIVNKSVSMAGAWAHTVETDGHYYDNVVTLTATGFSLYRSSTTKSPNDYNVTYSYTAFKMV